MRNTRPELAEELHPTKNGDLTPDNLMAGTSRKLWWICKEVSDEPCGHVWKASGGERLKHGCPPCGKKKAAKSLSTPKHGESLGDIFPEISSQWHPSLNNDKSPFDFNPGTDQKVWWKCPVADDHVWEANISSRTAMSTGCPYCAGKRVSITNSISTLLPEIVDEWDTSKNGEILPSEVVGGSMKKFWWKCSKCEHEWKISPSNRKFGSGCPACANKALHIGGRNSLMMTHPELAAEFDLEKNAPLTPETLIAGTNKSLWWICSDCSHEWSAGGNTRASAGNGCPACAGQSLHIDGRNSMMSTHPEIAAEFDLSKNAPITTEDIVAGTHKLYWWGCKTCSFEWRSSPANRSRHNTGCPACVNLVVHIDGRNSMRATHPELAAEFDSERNAPLTPDSVVAGTGKRLNWICISCSHKWIATGNGRVSKDSGCPKCAPGGFDLNKPGQYYVLRILNSEGDTILFKGGISNDYRKRIEQHRKFFANHPRSDTWALKLEEVCKSDDGDITWELESRLLRESEIRAPSIEGLSSELFLSNPLEHARSMGLV